MGRDITPVHVSDNGFCYFKRRNEVQLCGKESAPE
jgi:hypothetical protein